MGLPGHHPQHDSIRLHRHRQRQLHRLHQGRTAGAGEGGRQGQEAQGGEEGAGGARGAVVRGRKRGGGEGRADRREVIV